MINKLLVGAAVLCASAIANAQIVPNGDFETGDFSGWASSSFFPASNYRLINDASKGNSTVAELTANAYLVTGQPVQWHTGSQLTFDWKFVSQNNASAFLEIIEVAYNAEGNLEFVGAPERTDLTGTGWQQYHQTFTANGLGFIGFGILSADLSLRSQLVLDNVNVNEPSTLWLLGCALAVFGTLRRKRSSPLQ